MAYLSKNLSVLAYANGFTLWHYTTPDKADEIAAPKYFDPAAEMVRIGDMVLANTDTENGMKGAILLCTGNQAGAVDMQSIGPDDKAAE